MIYRSEAGFFFSDDIKLAPDDLRWVGAWWLGFLVASGLIFITALPYFFFPRSMSKEVGRHKQTETVPKLFSLTARLELPETLQPLYSDSDFLNNHGSRTWKISLSVYLS